MVTGMRHIFLFRGEDTPNGGTRAPQNYYPAMMLLPDGSSTDLTLTLCRLAL